MRMRTALWALLASAGLIIAGCGKAEPPQPPPGAETDVPTLEIDEGAIIAPEESSDAQDSSEKTP
jgi:hypothetical protein